MKIDIQAALRAAEIEFVLLDNDVIATNIESEQNLDQVFQLIIYQWTAGNEQDYIRLMITPFLEKPENGYSVDLVYQVLMNNHQLPIARFIFDQDEDLAIAIDINANEWTQEKLMASLGILLPYADHYFSELESL